MSDLVSLPGSHQGGSVPVASSDFASVVLNAIFQEDGGDGSKLNYALKSKQSDTTPGSVGILIDSTPGAQYAGAGVMGLVDESTTPGADTLIGSGSTQFMIASNAAGDEFKVNGPSTTVSGGSGNDTVVVGSGDYATTYLGGGDNQVKLDEGAGVYLQPGTVTGNDTVDAKNVDGAFVSVGGSGYDATINISGATDLGDTIDGAGGQKINISGGGSTVEIGAQSDLLPDVVKVTGGSSTIDLDPGAAIVASGSFSVVNSNDTPTSLTGLAVTTAGGATITGGLSGGTIFQASKTELSGTVDSVIAGSGATTLYGGSGTEYFTDTSGSATFLTGNGTNFFTLGGSSDLISNLGSGSATFKFDSVGSAGTDTIMNFSQARDTIDLSAYGEGNVTVGATTGTSQATDVTTISLSDGTKIIVHGIFSSADIKY
jgi:Ca2+-binding RTX toxin-like protein